jgi:hypothetical protein
VRKTLAKNIWLLALFAVTIFAPLNSGFAGELEGSLKALCLTAEGEVSRTLPRPRLHFELFTEARYEGHEVTRRLVARLQIQRASLRVSRVGLVSSLTSLRTVSAAEFKNYCGDSFVLGNNLGQSIEFSWMLSNRASVDMDEHFADTQLDWDGVNAPSLEEFARLVAARLKGFDGQVTGSVISAKPASAVDVSTCGGPLGCFAQLLNGPNGTELAALDVLTRPLTAEALRTVQAGHTLDLGSL